MPQSTLYDRVGGDAFFDELTRRFYDAVRDDSVLRPLYPADEDGFEAARVHLRAFLVQFWGGPALYREQRGEPRLRLRHAPFVIGVPERDAWVAHMAAAVRAARLPALEEMQLLRYFEGAATQMINVGG